MIPTQNFTCSTALTENTSPPSDIWATAPASSTTCIILRSTAKATSTPPKWRASACKNSATSAGCDATALKAGRSSAAALGQRQPDTKAGAAARAILDLYAAAEAVKKMPGDGKAEPSAAAVAVARGLEPQERLEDPLALGRGHARPAIIDQHDDLGCGLRYRHCCLAAIFHRVVQKVADDARECGRLAPDVDRGRWQVARDCM